MQDYKNLQDFIKTKYSDDYILSNLVSLIKDASFLEVLDKNTRDNLINSLNNINVNTHNILAYKPQISDVVFKYISYRANKIKNVSEYEKKYEEFENKINNAEQQLENIKNTSLDINGATVLVSYAKDFDRQATKHNESAKNWRLILFALLVGFIILIGITFFISISDFNYIKNHLAADLTYKIVVTSISIKIGLIFGYIQFIRFINRNYNAEKHLENVYLHRRNVLQTLHAVYGAISNAEEKDRILSAGALLAFERGETGYITTKEGAGSDDSVLNVLLSKFK